MSENSTPWRTPKPHPMAFASTGTLPKKHQATKERASLPVTYTPETPLKKERSKFVIPANLSPFVLSPKAIVLNGSQTLPGSARPSTLSASFGTDCRLDAEKQLSASPSLRTRSSSPVQEERGYQIDTVFNGDSGSDFDDPFNVVNDFPMDIEAKQVAGSTMLPGVPWKSPHAIFFTNEFFACSNWPDGLPSHSTPTSSIYSDSNFADSEYFEEQFEVIDSLGRGSFSYVFHVKRRTDGAQFALKRSRVPFSGNIDRCRRLQEVANMWTPTAAT